MGIAENMARRAAAAAQVLRTVTPACRADAFRDQSR